MPGSIRQRGSRATGVLGSRDEGKMSDKEATLNGDAPQVLADTISDIQALMPHKEELEVQGKA